MATRSLGRLTLDLIAKVGNFEGGLSKADRAAKKHFKNIEKRANQAAKGLLVIGTAITGVTAKVIANTIKQEDAVRLLESQL